MSVKEKEIYGKCPACGGNIVEGEKNYFCVNYEEPTNCKVNLHKLIMGKTIDKAQAREFFSGKYETEEMEGIMKDGGEVTFKLVYDKEKKKIHPEYQNSGPQETLGECPLCGKNIYQAKKNYFCEGYKEEPKCDFVVFKEDSGARITPEMMKKMLLGETIKDHVCKTKEGKEYTASFKIPKSGENKGKLVKMT